ncbi:zinc transporter ZntB [Pacificispira sp.]|uniref:zinc transporter ZntB n=1 Tax=Pacificispira sp. TaxID=2888761 RepID=UPI003BADB59E
MVDTSPFICTYRLDGNGGAQSLSIEEAKQAWKSDESGIWVHLNRNDPGGQAWLVDESGLDPLITTAMLLPETRPRFDPAPGGVIVNLRGINLNEGAQPEDMVSIRCFCDGKRLVTARLPRLRAVDDVRAALEAGRGAKTPGQILTAIADRLTTRIGELIMKIDGEIDQMEEDFPPDETLLGDLRRKILELRRYVAPQREALARASGDFDETLDLRAHSQFAEVRERTARLLEDLEVLRDRTQILRDEISDMRNDKMNRAMYSLSLVAGLFLPLGFVTGLLGINVGGMPGVDDGAAFWIVCILLVLLGIAAWLLFRIKKWL